MNNNLKFDCLRSPDDFYILGQVKRTDKSNILCAVEHGSLSEYLNAFPGSLVNEDSLRDMVRCVAGALVYLEGNDIIHHKIKSTTLYRCLGLQHEGTKAAEQVDDEESTVDSDFRLYLGTRSCNLAACLPNLLAWFTPTLKSDLCLACVSIARLTFRSLNDP
ncbi:hypothetical protein NMY22_g9900 [Coprinellus aureogranulatus]|nr:hypothetical protein NMY22_g9900 [Coprinellus aureogranulatus]